MDLVDCLLAARELGFLGPGPVEDHLNHARRYVEAVTELGAPTSPLLDLGAGGGVPGLILAEEWQDAEAVLLDSNERRCYHLNRAVRALGLTDRVSVLHARAEEAARTDLRASFPLVVARSFGPPAVTAECAAGFLTVGGYLVVSEPPGERTVTPPGGPLTRWPDAGLGVLGQRRALASPGVVAIRQDRVCPGRFPRRVGVPRKRPLF